MKLTLAGHVIFGEIQAGKLVLSQSERNRLARLVAETDDTRIELQVIPGRSKRTFEQNAAFHGPIIEQCRRCHFENEGEQISPQEMKKRLKDQFLERKPRLHEGRPTFIRERVIDEWVMVQIFEAPSTASLSVDEFTTFIREIVEHYWHTYGWAINITSD